MDNVKFKESWLVFLTHQSGNIADMAGQIRDWPTEVSRDTGFFRLFSLSILIDSYLRIIFLSLGQ
jgi:hypothetical protein